MNRCSLPSMVSGGESFPLSFRCSLSQLGVAISIYHLNRLNWPCWLFTPMVSDYWAELHWIAIPSQRAMSQLLSFSPPRRLQHWAADAVACSGPWNTRFSAPRLFFLCSHALFLPSLLPFSIFIKGHPSAKYGSTFSCYPNSTVSALWTREHWLLLLLLLAAEGRLQTMHSNTANICLHRNSMSLLPEWFTEYSAYKVSASWGRLHNMHGVN